MYLKPDFWYSKEAMSLSTSPTVRRVQRRPISTKAPLSHEILDRRVGKSGAVCIPGLEQGTRVRVISVRAGVYIVSPLPLADMEKIVELIPPPAESPFAALSATLEVRTRTTASQRSRHTFTGIVELALESAEVVLAKASHEKPRRRPR
jgi:hypothetical protein